jgi:hypothetical protein
MGKIVRAVRPKRGAYRWAVQTWSFHRGCWIDLGWYQNEADAVEAAEREGVLSARVLRLEWMMRAKP